MESKENTVVKKKAPRLSSLDIIRGWGIIMVAFFHGTIFVTFEDNSQLDVEGNEIVVLLLLPHRALALRRKDCRKFPECSAASLQQYASHDVGSLPHYRQDNHDRQSFRPNRPLSVG